MRLYLRLGPVGPEQALGPYEVTAVPRHGDTVRLTDSGNEEGTVCAVARVQWEYHADDHGRLFWEAVWVDLVAREAPGG